APGASALDQNVVLVGEQTDVLRRLVAGAVPDGVLLPVALLPLRVLEPVAGGAGEVDHDQVRPAVPVEVVGPAAEAVAVAGGPVAVVAEFADLVHLPRRGLVPGLAGEDVHLAVPVDVGDGDALGAEGPVGLRLLPAAP